jgi:hypothetical protein
MKKSTKQPFTDLYFVKSFEEDHSTKHLVGKQKKTFQTLADILATKTIRLNTKSFGQQRRLCTTILHKNYTKTYRPQGIIFKTKGKPSYMLPFDLVLLSNAEKLVVHYYRIKDNLHAYYNHKLIPGYEKFIFKDITRMLEKFDLPSVAWKELNAFRTEHGYESLPRSKYRLVEYNEAVFLKPVIIEPIALFGYRAETKTLAKKSGLPWYRSAKDFYLRDKKNKD